MRKNNETEFSMSDFYNAVGGNMEEVIDRLEDIDLVKTSIFEFLEDPSYAELMESLENHDIESAFRSAHTLKGICYTFGFKRLGDVSAAVCEKLRGGCLPTKDALHLLTQEYGCVLRAIHKLPNCR